MVFADPWYMDDSAWIAGAFRGLPVGAKRLSFNQPVDSKMARKAPP